jgi:AraC family transcriptional regulator, positive regulator of tynA and feaB
MPMNPGSDPPLPRFIEQRNTSTIPAADRLDCWRIWHPTVSLSPLSESARLGLLAEFIRYRAPDGCLFGFTKSESVETRFGDKNPADYFLLGIPVTGTGCADAGKANLPLRPGSHSYLIDGRRAVRIRVSTGFSHLHLLLPCQPVIGIIGRDPFTAASPFVELADRGLLGIVPSMMQAIVDRIGELTEVDMAAAMRSLSGLVVTGLQRQLGIAGDVDRPNAYDVLFLTACRLIELHYADRQLAASTIAVAAGCSRAHLYRAFARRGTTFANVLRDVRLNKAKALLLGPRARSIAQVASMTGYADQSSFSRAFHAELGLTPRDWSRAHLKPSGR